MTMFGWCLDGHHVNCRERVAVPGGITTCGCPCHKLPEATKRKKPWTG